QEMRESSVLTPETPRRADHIAYMRAREREIACCSQRYRSERALRRTIFVLWVPGDKWIDPGYRAESGGATIEGRSHRAQQEGRDYEPGLGLTRRGRRRGVLGAARTSRASLPRRRGERKQASKQIGGSARVSTTENGTHPQIR